MVNSASAYNSKLLESTTFTYANPPSISDMPTILSNVTMFEFCNPCAVVVVTSEGVVSTLLTISSMTFWLYSLFCNRELVINVPKNAKLSLVCSSCEVTAILPLTLE